MSEPVKRIYCDSHPSARAQKVALTPGGPLAFCGHCYEKHQLALASKEYTIIDVKAW